MATHQVAYLRRTVVIERYSISVEAETEAEARERVRNWENITDDELETDNYVRDVEQVDSQPIGLWE